MPRVVQSEYRQIVSALRHYGEDGRSWTIKTKQGLKDPSKWVWSETVNYVTIDKIDSITNLDALRRAIRAIKEKRFVAGQEHKLYSLQNREKVLTSEIKRATLETSTDEGASTRPRVGHINIDYNRLQNLYRGRSTRTVTPIFTEVTSIPDDFFQ